MNFDINGYRNWPRYGLGRKRPSDGRPHSCCVAVAAQTTTAQTVWLVNFYSTTKTKQYTAINAATMNRHAETSLAGNANLMKAST